jgi:hypothetical protein
MRRQLIAFAHSRHRPDLAAVLEHPPAERQCHANAVERAIEMLRVQPVPQPQVTDDVALWLAPRTA